MPSPRRFISVALLATVLVASTLINQIPAQAQPPSPIATVFFYGLGDGYLGHHHAAYWHGQTPTGWEQVVDLKRPGIATSWLIPFGTVLCLSVVSVPLWAEAEYTHLIGRTACGVVVDRMAGWVERHYGPSLDLWPALAEELMGPDFRRIGTVRVEIVSWELRWEPF